MIGAVYFIDMSIKQVEEINTSEAGWGSDIGKAYMQAKRPFADSEVDRTAAMKHGMVRLVAVIEVPHAEGFYLPAERIWTRLQNGVDDRKDELAKIIAEVPNRRSMDIGDFIIWDDGSVDRCEDSGFTRE